MDLAGTWECRVGPGKEPRRVRLPGSLDEIGVGDPPAAPSLGSLTRLRAYEGPAEFRREVAVPAEWAGLGLSLTIERSRSTEVFWDGESAGTSSCLSAAQRFDLGAATPGKHELRIVSDNASGVMSWPSVRNSHAASDGIQTNWNGVLGRIELEALPALRIADLGIVAARAGETGSEVDLSFDVRDDRPIDSATGGSELEVEVVYAAGPAARASVVQRLPALRRGALRTTIRLALGPEFPLWDDLDPRLVDLEVSLVRGPAREVISTTKARIGLRKFEVAGTNFTVNGRKVFLRGKHEAGVFPLTGYAPMDVASWRRVFGIAKEWGINHYRFHSWCPPEAAFVAADEIGMYLQPELPFWNPKDALESDEEYTYYLAEALRIVDAYRNHPSFVMFALGNELVGSRERMGIIIDRCRERLPGLLCAIGSNNFLTRPAVPEGSDYWTTFWTSGRWNFRKSGYGGKNVRGSTPHSTRGHVNNEPPSTDFDYSRAIDGVGMPVITHEIGQYQVFPDFAEIEKYTGLLKAKNFEAFKAAHDGRGIGDRSREFQLASGRLAALCYREEIEAALRTPALAGFQLLDLQDFPGQGTALVGLLDAFMDSKGLIEPEEWRAFCADTVPLLRARKRVWESGERFSARVDLAHYGREAGTRCVVRWSISFASSGDADGSLGEVVAEGELGPIAPHQGEVTSFGEIAVDLGKRSEARRLRARLELAWIDTDDRRSPAAPGAVQSRAPRGPAWDFWIFPPAAPVVIPDDVLVVRSWDDQADGFLAEGGKVFYLPDLGSGMVSVPGAFIPDFWCYPMFKKYDPPGTLGILCDPSHPALAGFPTDFHADWQWWHLLKSSRPLVLPPALKGLEPIVRVIDNVHRGWPLGLVFELSSGSGKLLVCGIDLIGRSDRPEFADLYRRLLAYMESPAFAPAFSIDRAALGSFLRPGSADGTARAEGTDFYG